MNTHSKLLAIAAMMGAVTSQGPNLYDVSPGLPSYTGSSVGGRTKTQLTKKQQKARKKEKSARKSRKQNRKH